MTMRKYFSIILFMPLLLCACISSPSRPAGPLPPTVDRSKTEPAAAPTEHSILAGTIFEQKEHLAETMIDYGKRFGEMTAEQQKKEQAQVMQALSRNKKDTPARLKAAMIYSLPDSRYRDNARALSLLNELQREKLTEEEVASLIEIIQDFVEERQKLEDNAVKLNQKIKDEQHRADELQQKLDALKNIEKTMIDRGQGTSK